MISRSILIVTTSLLVWLVQFQKSYAQDEYDTVVVQDIETWTSASFQIKLGDKFDIALNQQFRFHQNTAELERLFTQVEACYKLHKTFEVAGGYRFISESKKSGIQNGHRWNIDGKYKFKLARLNGYARIRYQSGKEFGQDDILWNNHFRCKTKLKYNIKNWKLDPYFAMEFFRTSGKNVVNQVDKLRLTIGTAFKINKQHRIALFYGGEKEQNTVYPKTTYLIGVGYAYVFKCSKNEE